MSRARVCAQVLPGLPVVGYAEGHSKVVALHGDAGLDSDACVVTVYVIEHKTVVDIQLVNECVALGCGMRLAVHLGYTYKWGDAKALKNINPVTYVCLVYRSL